MHGLDWLLFVGFLAWVVWDGIRRTRTTHDASGYFLAGRSIPWWAMGLSIMATQASAITMIGTTGQGFADGLRFIQFYFALPLAMLILSVTAVPLYHRLQVSTAYEYLGIRFDSKTRLLAALLFLILRGLSVGFVIYTPALILSRVLSLPLNLMVVAMGGVAVLYTSIGGLAAVIRTDVKQMAVMTIGLLVAFVALISKLPEGVGVTGALSVASAAGRLQAVDFSWNPAEKYTVWSSLIGGLFLFLSYFGTDQSQVQRLLAGRSLGDTRRALLMNALAKIPFQLLVLGCGVLLFVFYTFHGTPPSFDPAASRAPAMQVSGELEAVERDYLASQSELRDAAYALAEEAAAVPAAERFRRVLARSGELRERARELRGGAVDTNYVFLDFILNHLPVGVVGLLLAAIFAAALSSIDSELNSMTTVAVLDIYQFARREPLVGSSLVRVSRVATVLVGVFATAFALYAGQLGSLIEAVNRVGSYIYGSLLGVFILAIAVKRANGNGAFLGLLIGMAVVSWQAQTGLAFLYLNTVGALTVVVAGTLLSRPSATAHGSIPGTV